MTGFNAFKKRKEVAKKMKAPKTVQQMAYQAHKRMGNNVKHKKHYSSVDKNPLWNPESGRSDEILHPWDK